MNQFILPGIIRSDSLLAAGNYIEAMKIAQGIIDSVGENANYIETSSRAYYIIARANLKSGNRSIALRNYLLTLQSLKILKNNDLISQVCRDLGKIYESWGLIVKSIEYYQSALDHESSLKNQIDLYYKISSLFVEIQNFSNSNLYLSRLLKLYHEPEDDNQIITILEQLTENHLRLKLFDKAIFLQAQILQIQEQNHQYREELITINKMAHIYLEMGNYEYAMKYFHAYFNRLGNTRPYDMDLESRALFAKTKITFGSFLEHLGNNGEPDNYKNALDYYQQGLGLFIAMNDKKNTSDTYYRMGDLYYKLGDYKNALLYSDNAVLIAESIPDNELLMNSFNLLTQIYERLEKYKQSLQASKQYEVYKDSVENKRNADRLDLIKKQSDYNNNESFVHRIEQMITEEEMNNLLIARLELQADKNKQEIELLAKEKKLQEYSLITEQLEKEKALKDLELVNQKYDTEKMDREIDNLEKNREIQTLALKQQILEQKEKERAISMLEQDKQLDRLKLQKANSERFVLIMTVLLTIIVMGLVIKSYILTKQSKEKIAKKNAEIQSNNLKLQELNIEKNRLIRIVAHDLRNPLSCVIAMTGALKKIEKNNPREYSHSLQLIRKALLRMQEMIVKILDVKAIEEATINIDLEAINLKKVIEHITELFQDRLRTKNIEVNCDLLEIYALADKNYLIQVLENLLSNAIKFSGAGSRIYIRIIDYDEKCRITLKDEGPGFNERDQVLMFTEYQKLSSKPTAGEESTGIGLSIVKKYMDSMNGRIWCDSTLGQGSVFTLEFHKGLIEA